MPTRETITVQEFGPELAGELVGWFDVAVREHPHESAREHYGELTELRLTTAVVAKEGARYFYTPGPDGEPHFWSNDKYGLLGQTATAYTIFEKLARGDSSPTSAPMTHYPPGKDGFSWTGYDDVLAIPSEGGTWVAGAANIMPAVKSALAETSAPDYAYPWLYYMANRRLTQRFEDNRTFQLEPRVDTSYVVADPDMAGQTQIEVDKLLAYNDVVNQMIAEDEAEGLRLHAAMGTGTAAEHADEFEASRRKMRQLYLAGHTAMSDAYFGFHVPTGLRPHGRSWPYMSYDEENENAAYGNELRGLKAGNAHTALREIEKELSEDRRIKQVVISNDITSILALQRAEMKLLAAWA